MLHSSPAFQELYGRLNNAQKQAVDTIEGPVMVIAGPGTGKTQVLTLRIANILLKTDTSPDAILALTFTEAGVQAMRKRLLSIIGPDAYRVKISTFHGFCNTVISLYPEEFPRIIGASPVLQVDQIAIMGEVIQNSPLSKLRPYGDPLFYVRSALAAISDLKRENVSPDFFEKIIADQERDFSSRADLYHVKGAHKGKMKGEHQDAQKQIEKNKELAIVYRAYEEALRERRLYDFNDMILEVVRAMEGNEDLLLRLQEQHQYILADEHQDANAAQNKLLELLVNFHDNPNLFIVGDEKQAIYRFQGASLENFLYFKRLYPEARIINLTENYRSTQRILDSAHSLIGRNKVADERLALPLIAKTAHSDVHVKVVAVETAAGERAFLTRQVRKLLDEGVAPGEIAILYRDNKDAFEYARVLEKADTPILVESEQNVLDSDEVKKIIMLLRAVSDFGNDEHLVPLLHLDFLGFDEWAIFKLFAEARKERRLVYDLARESELFQPFMERLARWSKAAKNRNILEVLEMIMNESGFLGEAIAGAGSRDRLDRIKAFFEEVRLFVENHKDEGFPQLLKYLDTLHEHRISVGKRPRNGYEAAVRLMTAHRSKGLEFEHVFIVGAYDGHWGNKRRAEQFRLPIKGADEEGNDDERRLFYVSLTRAKKTVTISYPRAGSDGRELLPSQFISEIDMSNLEALETTDQEVLFAPEITYRLHEDVSPSLYDKEYLTNLFLESGISATALSNYIECPWIYFYENLIKVPRASNKMMMYGTAVHAALRAYFDKLKEGEDIGNEALVVIFEKVLRNQPLPEGEFQESLERGKKALVGYYREYKNSWNSRTENEFAVPSVMLDDKIKLTGTIDKIEILENGRDVNVVDYKTGKPKTRGEIMGTTKTSNGNYIRQLRFYKLLLDRHQEGRFHMISGDVDFIEPDEKGKYHKEHFEITKEEVLELENEIRRVADEIINLSFWNKKCEDKECRYCDLRRMIKK